MSVKSHYNKVLEAYQIVENLCPLEGDKLSHLNGKLVRVNRVACNWDDETLIPVLQRINESAKTVFEGIENNDLILPEKQRVEFFRLRSTFATTMSDLEYRYRANQSYSKLRPVFSESFNVHNPKDPFIATSNDPIDFTRERNLFNKIIPAKRDQGEDLAIIRNRISEAKSHLLSRTSYIAKTVGKYFTFFLLFLPLTILQLNLNISLAGLKIFGLLRNVHSFDFLSWGDSVSTKLFSGLKERSMAKSALSCYAYQLKDELRWDEERFKLFESVAPFLENEPDLFRVELELNKKDYLELGLSSDEKANKVVVDIIERLNGSIYLRDAMIVTKTTSRMIARYDNSELERFIDRTVKRLEKEEVRPNSKYNVIMNPSQLMRYLEVYKKHTRFRRVGGMDLLVGKADIATYSSQSKNNLFSQVEKMGFTVKLLKS
ncbi:MAG: hypothetical protein K1060chlam4_00080 [Candidatus Anoxychlamydiales bacterium]|nr:hypothetical protein [Candidatus Anoxychlamydiales bacterium]